MYSASSFSYSMNGQSRHPNSGQRRNANQRSTQNRRDNNLPREPRESRFRDYKHLELTNLNPKTHISTIFDYFQTFCQVEKAKFNSDDSTESPNGTAIVTFRQIPKGSLREDLARQHKIDGYWVHAQFSLEDVSYTQQRYSDQSNLNAQRLSLGNFIGPRHFAEQWSTDIGVRYKVAYSRRSVDIYFVHFNVEYHMNYNFKEVEGGMIVEKENNNTIFTIPLRYPTRYWKRNDGVFHETKTEKSASGWERVTTIPLFDTSGPEKKLKGPLLPAPREGFVKIGAWTVLRLTFSPESRGMALFNKEMQRATEYNLVPRDPSKMKPCIKVTPASELPTPLNYFDRLKYDFDFNTFYSLESAISYGYINENNVNEEFYSTIKQLDPSVVCGILDLISLNKKRVWDPMTTFRNTWSKMELKVCQSRKIPNHCAMLRKAIVTPSKIYLQPPNLETTNRVVRHYKDHTDRFIRVQFTDDGFGRVGAARAKTTNENVYNRIFSVLKRGIQIGDRTYEFLAFSSSQLREHGCWFFASTPDLTPDMIRNWMGVFSHEKVVAKHAVRMGQCFSSTRPVCHLEEDEVDFIEDIVRNKYTFSDGVGRIAPSLADEVALQMEIRAVPSAFQFRLGGAKGVLTVDNKLSTGKTKVQLRPSQKKFESKHLTLEVIRTSTYIHGYLNRQAITLLSSLGVKDDVFLELMKNMLRDIDRILSRPEEAVRVLLSSTDEAGTAPTMATIIQAGFLERGDPHIKNLLNLFRVNILKDLKKKAKILVPHGAFLLGVMDETGILEEGEVFVQVWDTSNNGTIKQVITGECVVFRNPCFHPGDIRVVKAVDRPELRHLMNVVVFASRGFRDIPSMCSGGDLDGDDYTIFWDPKLMPTKKNYTPMDYSAPSPRFVEDVTITDIKKFFVNYINNDNLGQIANAHLATADASDNGARDGKCIKLAHLHSEAVDFPKSGKPAVLSDDLIVKRFPDFMQKKDKESYASTKVLGHIFRSIDKSDYKDYMSKLTDEAKYDVCMYVAGMEYYIGEARQLRGDFNRDLLGLMNQNGVQTEAEITSGYIIKWLKKGKSKTRFEQHDSTMKAVKAFKTHWRKEFEREFLEEGGKTIDHSHGPAIDSKAAAWYYVTYHPEERQKNRSDKSAFLSFPWVIFDYVCEIAKKNKHRNQDPSYFLPIAEAIITKQYEKRLSSKRNFASENGDEEFEDPIETSNTEDEYDYDSDFSDNDDMIYGANTGMFAFNNDELRRAVHELSQDNNPVHDSVNQRPANAGSNTQPIVRPDATMDDLMKAISG